MNKVAYWYPATGSAVETQSQERHRIGLRTGLRLNNRESSISFHGTVDLTEDHLHGCSVNNAHWRLATSKPRRQRLHPWQRRLYPLLVVHLYGWQALR